MIAKILQSGYNDSGNFPAAAIIPSFSGGLDRQSLHKQASIFEKEYDQFERKPGHTYIHLISCAAGEFYGPNSRADFYNGDSYRHDFPHPEKGGPTFVILDGGLNKYHNKTFMEEGGVYTEHFSSRDGAKPQGYIVAAKMNPDMHRGELIIGVRTNEWADDIEKLSNGSPLKFSIGLDTNKDTCFPKGTLVLTPEGYKKIETLVIGDEVKTNQGNISEVVATSKRFTDKLVRLNVMGLPLEIECTTNHPFDVVREESLRSCHGSTRSRDGKKLKRRHTLDSDGKCVCCHRIIDLPSEWVAAGDIVNNDYLRIKVDSNATENTVGVDFAYLCGLYVGDGCLSWGSVGQATGYDGYSKRINGINISMSIDVEGVSITEKAKRAFKRITGKDATVRSETNDKQAVVIGLFDKLLGNRIYSLCGAGSHKKYISEEIFGWSAEEKAAFIAGYLDADGCVTDSVRVARICSVNRGLALSAQRLLWSIGVRATCYVSNQDNKSSFGCSGPSYAVGLREFTELLCKHSAKMSKHKDLIGHKMNGGTVLLHRGYAYLRVVSTRVFESSPVAVYNIEVAGDHTYNAEGADVHNCSYCGHVAHTENQHCDHYKHNRGMITDDGSQIYVITDKGVFHDISRVRNPAEKIAFSIKKIARADDFSLWQPGRIKPESAKYLLKTATGLRRFNTLDKLAKIEKEILAVANSGSLDKHITRFFRERNQNKQQKRASEEDSGELLNKFLDHVNQDQLFNGLRENKKILTPGEFTIIAVPENYRKGGYGIDIDEIESLLPGIFNKILHRDDVDEFCEDETYECDTQCPRIIVDQLGRVPCGCSLDVNDLMRSVINAEDVDLTPAKRTVIIEISKPVTNVNELIADDYASYVVSAADRLSPTELAMNILNYVL